MARRRNAGFESGRSAVSLMINSNKKTRRSTSASGASASGGRFTRYYERRPIIDYSKRRDWGGRSANRAANGQFSVARGALSTIRGRGRGRRPRGAVAALAESSSNTRRRTSRNFRRTPQKKVNAEDLDAQLDSYMGEDVRKARLDTELAEYFANQPQQAETKTAETEAGEIIP